MTKKKARRQAEVCRELGIQPYVLRYWETEFTALEGDGGPQRSYSEQDFEILERVKQLLYDEGYTIAGAKKKLDAELTAGTVGASLRAADIESEEEDLAEPEREDPGAVADSNALAASRSAPVQLDMLGDQQIEHVLRGLRSLRDEARELLENLRGSASS